MYATWDPIVQSHFRSVVVSAWVLWPFTVIILLMRFYSRIARQSLGVDDWCMSMAWLLFTTASSLQTAIVARGALNHIKTIPPDDLEWILKVTTALEITGMLTTVFGKTAVGLLLVRLMKGLRSKWRNYFIYAHLIIYWGISITFAFLIYFQCNPPKANWHPELVELGEATCRYSYVEYDFTFVQSSYGTYLDFMLAILPVTFIYKLQITLKQKLAIAVLLGLGIFAGVCTLVKTITFTNGFHSSDPTYNTWTVFIWSNLELAFVIICGSVPPAKPAFDQLFKGKLIRTKAGPDHTPTADIREPKRKPRNWFSILSTGNNTSEKGLNQDSQDNHDMESQNHRDSRHSIMVEKTVSVEYCAEDGPAVNPNRF